MRRREILSLGVAVGAVPAARLLAAEMDAFPHDMALDPAFVPKPAPGGAPQVLTRDIDRRTITAVFDRFIPGDELGPSASAAGCVEFLDAQLAGPFGQGATLYRAGPKAVGEDALMQKPQFIATPRERYETGLRALEAYARRTHQGSFADLKPEQQDAILTGMEKGEIELAPEVNTRAFFELMLANAREGYFADPLYGGNKDMAGWKMIGFPGARYDYRLYADRTGEDLGLEPVSLVPKA
ncbi:gluconate 2-dehydrogenase subunit 3 family protein [Sphingomonas sp. AP4-R1]|uniref:gluconate 2-dehydrogenase subunit 3 family protein n=1 Tax=Sphingomonas sp. AP4-R1 TaxID=2735134 RepID=UPI001493AF3B|nr:gluconate 2-dehydrogenase subunit 3 family protein [Sphingomonas sp. AP4-R1]QJU57907.1 gluconate 2-dehydrogenase subunit 3 family protein [Sphingomonas sp. AP4-R1]